mgnify:FL=1
MPITAIKLNVKTRCNSNHLSAQLLSSCYNFGHAAIGVFEPLNDAIANRPNSFANWNVNIETGMRVLAQHGSVVIKGEMQHAA